MVEYESDKLVMEVRFFPCASHIIQLASISGSQPGDPGSNPGMGMSGLLSCASMV